MTRAAADNKIDPRVMTALKSGAQALLEEAFEELDNTGSDSVEGALCYVTDAKALLDLYTQLIPDGPVDGKREPKTRRLVPR